MFKIGSKIKKIVIILTFLYSAIISIQAQQLNLKTGNVSFTISAPAGELLARDSMIKGSIQLEDGSLAFEVDVRQFRFISSFMPDYINKGTTSRFHKYYLETESYPTATYKARIVDFKKTNYSKNGIYNITTTGAFTMHGVTRKISVPGTLTINGNEIVIDADFMINPVAYKIKIPESIASVFFKEVPIKVHTVLTK